MDYKKYFQSVTHVYQKYRSGVFRRRSDLRAGLSDSGGADRHGDGPGTGGDLVYGSPDLRSSDHHGTGMVQYLGPDRRSRRSGADYRVCEFYCSSGDGI